MGFDSRDGGINLAIPIWLPILLLASLAVVPWMRWQFSLRTLLVATTLVAVVLGLAFYAARK